MFSSKNGNLTIQVVEDMSQVAFPPSDFSVFNMPDNGVEAARLFKNLYNTPTTRHLSLVFNRHKRHNKLASLANLYSVESWEYFDSITVQYEKTLGSNNGRFVPVSETAHLFYKGQQPDAGDTAWFSDGRTNATNLWDVTAREEELHKFTYNGKFSWETGMLLYSMVKPLAFRTFIYALDTDQENAIAFASHFKLKIQTYCKAEEQALKLIADYEVKNA